MAKKTKSGISPEEKAKREAYEKAVMRLPSTYSVVTAEKLLKGFGLDLNHKIISKIIQNPQAFYHGVLYLPAKRLSVTAATEQCRDIQGFGQQKLIHYLFSGEASKNEDEPGNAMRASIEDDRQTIVKMGKDFVAWEEGMTNRFQKVYDELAERLYAWYRTVDEVIKDWVVLIAEWVDSPDEALQQLATECLKKGAIDIKLSQEDRSEYKLPEQIGLVETMTIGLLKQQQKQDLLSSSVLISTRPKFEELDKKLQSEFDSLTGFNQEGKISAESDLKTIKEMTESFEKMISQVSRKLFQYYHEYSSESSLRVSAENALELGVDEIVADDYKALHK